MLSRTGQLRELLASMDNRVPCLTTACRHVCAFRPLRESTPERTPTISRASGPTRLRRSSVGASVRLIILINLQDGFF